MSVLRPNSRRFCGFMIVALLLASLSVCLIPSVHAAEPTLENILDTLGFTQRTLVSTQTFVAGDYTITMWAEFAGYRDQNQLRWYPVGTSTFNLIFDGPDGVPPGDPMGYVPSPETTATKSFTSSTAFGLSLLSPDSQSPFYTETSRDADGQPHAKVYQSTTNPNLYFIGFENMGVASCADFDYNDMVLSLEHVSLTRELKEDAITELNAAEQLTTNPVTLSEISLAVVYIQLSLNPSLWVDDFHLNPMSGLNVFAGEKLAAIQLTSILWSTESTAVKTIVQAVVGKLLQVDETLVDTAIADALALGSTDPRVIAKISEAQVLDSAAEHMTNMPFVTIVQFMLAWLDAQTAISINKTFDPVPSKLLPNSARTLFL